MAQQTLGLQCQHEPRAVLPTICTQHAHCLSCSSHRWLDLTPNAGSPTAPHACTAFMPEHVCGLHPRQTTWQVANAQITSLGTRQRWGALQTALHLPVHSLVFPTWGPEEFFAFEMPLLTRMLGAKSEAAQEARLHCIPGASSPVPPAWFSASGSPAALMLDWLWLFSVLLIALHASRHRRELGLG